MEQMGVQVVEVVADIMRLLQAVQARRAAQVASGFRTTRTLEVSLLEGAAEVLVFQGQ